MRALVEQGLRRVLAEEPQAGAFRLRDRSVNGHGLRPELQRDWEAIRAATYEGRGA